MDDLAFSSLRRKHVSMQLTQLPSPQQKPILCDGFLRFEGRMLKFLHYMKLATEPTRA